VPFRDILIITNRQKKKTLRLTLKHGLANLILLLNKSKSLPKKVEIHIS